MQDKVIWGTSNHAKSLKVQQLDPEMNVFLTTKGWWITVITFFLGLLPFMNLHYDTFSCPKFTVESKQELLKTGLKTFGDKFAYFFLGSVDKVQKLIFLHLQRRGIACLPWVLNDPQDFAESIEHGANGIMTDSPMLLNEYLIKTGKKFWENEKLKFKFDKKKLNCYFWQFHKAQKEPEENIYMLIWRIANSANILMYIY